MEQQSRVRVLTLAGRMLRSLSETLKAVQTRYDPVKQRFFESIQLDVKGLAQTNRMDRPATPALRSGAGG